MRRAGEPNFKWSIADVDFVVGLARAGRTGDQISARLRAINPYAVEVIRNGKRVSMVKGPIFATAEEIRDLCGQAGVHVKAPLELVAALSPKPLPVREERS